MGRFRLATVILLAASLSACTSYYALGDPAAELGASPLQLDEVRVTPVTGERFVLSSPVIARDSLFGLLQGGKPVSLALSDVKRIEARHVSTLFLGTAFCIVAVFAANAESCTVEGE